MAAKQNRIIALIDYSKYSEILLKFIDNLPIKSDYKLLLLHKSLEITPVLTDSNIRSLLEQKEIDNDKEWLKFYAKEKLISKNDFFSMVIKDSIIDTVDLLAKDADFENLIAIGSKGTNNIKTKLLGSTTTHIIDFVESPVIVIPELQKFEILTNCAIALSYHKRINVKQLIHNLKTYFPNIKTIDLLTVNRPKDNKAKNSMYLAEVSDVLESHNLKITSHFFEGEDVAGRILHFISSLDSCLLVAQKGGRSIKDKLFRKLIINELLLNLNTPLMVLNNE